MTREEIAMRNEANRLRLALIQAASWLNSGEPGRALDEIQRALCKRHVIDGSVAAGMTKGERRKLASKLRGAR